MAVTISECGMARSKKKKKKKTKGTQTWTMLSSSFDSLASKDLSSRSMLRVRFFMAEDCSLRLRDIIAAVWDAAEADSDWAVWVCVRSWSSSLYVINRSNGKYN